MIQNIVTSSAIEGEQLDVGSVRSSLARRLGLQGVDGDKVSQRSEGLAQLMLDATQHFAQPLTTSRLLEKGCLQRLPGGGRSTRYQVRYPDDSI